MFWVACHVALDITAVSLLICGLAVRWTLRSWELCLGIGIAGHQFLDKNPLLLSYNALLLVRVDVLVFLVPGGLCDKRRQSLSAADEGPSYNGVDNGTACFVKRCRSAVSLGIRTSLTP